MSVNSALAQNTQIVYASGMLPRCFLGFFAVLCFLSGTGVSGAPVVALSPVHLADGVATEYGSVDVRVQLNRMLLDAFEESRRVEPVSVPLAPWPPTEPDLNSSWTGPWWKPAHEVEVEITSVEWRMPALIAFGVRPVIVGLDAEVTVRNRQTGELTEFPVSYLVEDAVSRVLFFGRREILVEAALETAINGLAGRIAFDVGRLLGH